MAYEGAFLLVGRILFGILFLYNGYNHFVDLEGRAGYAEYKGLPAASAMVLLSGAVLVLGSLGIIFGVYPVISAAGIAVFLILSSILFHDYWTVDDAEERANQFNHFLKNVGLLGGAFVLMAVGTQTWAYAANIRFF